MFPPAPIVECCDLKFPLSPKIPFGGFNARTYTTLCQVLFVQAHSRNIPIYVLIFYPILDALLMCYLWASQLQSEDGGLNLLCMFVGGGAALHTSVIHNFLQNKTPRLARLVGDPYETSKFFMKPSNTNGKSFWSALGLWIALCPLSG